MLTAVLRQLFFLLIVRPVVLLVLGINARHRERLPAGGPALLVANHNSHLDTMVLMTLFPMRQLRLLRPVAAADYWLSTRLIGWFARGIIGIVPIARRGADEGVDLFAGCSEALAAGQILIFYPEGTRGEPEQRARFKRGIARLAARHPDVPVTPIFLHGVGKALPRGEALLVPFFVDAFIGEPLTFAGHPQEDDFMADLDARIEALAGEGRFSSWD